MSFREMGLDPEFFIVDGNNRIIPAQAFIPEPASKPFNEAPVAYDNAAIEIRPQPARCQIAFIGTVRELLWQAVARWRMARRQGIATPASRPSFAPAARIRPKDIDKYESLSTFGCSPSRILSPDGTEILDSFPDPIGPWRSAGYHIHTALGSYHQIANKNSGDLFLTRTLLTLDTFIGLTDVIMCHLAGWGEESRIRRQQLGYGLPGEHRLTKDRQRLEYRTPSPWILSHPMWTWWATTAMRHIVHYISNTNWLTDNIEVIPASRVHNAIMNCDAAEAYSILREVAPYWVDTMRLYSLHGSSTSGLGIDNLRTLFWTFNNGGHTAITRNAPLNVAWFSNHSAKKNGNEARYYLAVQRKLNGERVYVNRRLTIHHDQGLYRAFDSGSGRILKKYHMLNIQDLPLITDFPTDITR